MNVLIYVSILAACGGCISIALAIVSYRVSKLSIDSSMAVARQVKMNELLIKKLNQLEGKF